MYHLSMCHLSFIHVPQRVTEVSAIQFHAAMKQKQCAHYEILLKVETKVHKYLI